MLTLAIDTVSNFCSACLWDEASARVLAREERDIGRGHAEQLMDVIDGVMKKAGIEYADIGRVAVTIGPGSFTGIRVGVAAARGFGLSLDVPVVGVTAFEAIAADARTEAPDAPVTVAIRGGRGQVFMQTFAPRGDPLSDASAVDEADAAAAVPDASELVAGNAAAAVVAGLSNAGRKMPHCVDRATGSIATVARLLATAGHKPVPLYLRGADAKPQSGFALPRASEPVKAANP